MWIAFALQKLLTFIFSKKFQHICISLDVNVNESLTNNIVSFEQLGPDVQSSLVGVQIDIPESDHGYICKVLHCQPPVEFCFKYTHIISVILKDAKNVDSLRKHAYSNIVKILPPKNENFQIKKIIWYFSCFCSSAQNIGCGEAVLTSTHNLCFWVEIRKIMYTSLNPSFTI